MTAAVAVMAAVVLVLSIVAATRYDKQQSTAAEVPPPLAIRE